MIVALRSHSLCALFVAINILPCIKPLSLTAVTRFKKSRVGLGNLGIVEKDDDHNNVPTTTRRGMQDCSESDVAFSSHGTKSNPNCSYCGANFASRNALFKHLRSSIECFSRAAQEGGGTAIPYPNSGIDLPKQTIAINLGYHIIAQSDESSKISSNEVVVELVRNAFVAVFQGLGGVETLGVTFATAARLRHVALTQDALCSASSDVLVINFRSTATLDGNTLRERIGEHLKKQVELDCPSIDIRILDVELIPSHSNLHAEKDCTQRVYHYLLPLRWLTGGHEAKQWLLERPNTRYSTTGSALPGSPQDQRPTEICTPDVITRFKKALVLASSRTAWNRRERRNAKLKLTNPEVPPTNFVTSVGRYGALWRKEKRCLHNFSDPSLRGLASPNSEAVWRTVDRARSVDVLATKTDGRDDDVTLVIELRGDGFLSEEVRRIIASAVAVCNGWLPDDFFETATRPDVMVETPIAPLGRMYFFGARFHFQEDVNNLFLFSHRGHTTSSWLNELQDRLLCCCDSFEVLGAEEQWLAQFKDVLAPRIRARLQKVANEDMHRHIPTQEKISNIALNIGSLSAASNLPQEDESALYHDALFLLRQVSENKLWPSTSDARARVIRATPGLVTASHNTNVDGLDIQAGSFTVVNEKLFDALLPLGNTLFPDLVSAVFELEAKLASRSPRLADGTWVDDNCDTNRIRSPSSHCAINRNAEFTPHVDSGRGAGQSLSLIVGLGDFVGGGLVVDGQSYDVRYKPLEFDGWNQIHYTETFEGNERYSLVWFTPEMTVK